MVCNDLKLRNELLLARNGLKLRKNSVVRNDLKLRKNPDVRNDVKLRKNLGVRNDVKLLCVNYLKDRKVLIVKQ